MSGYPDIPGYQIECELGRGSMGVVVRATQLSLGRPVAIKLLQPGLASDRDLLSRFEREAKVVATLDHPNIVSVIDYGVADGVPYIVMQFVEGVTLDSMLTGRAFPVLAAVKILRQVAAALDYAHAHNVVHRDVKPGNVMIRSDGVVMLTDFGIAKAADASGLTHSGMSLGTPAYMAPEVCQGEPATAASDVYSLGVLSYEMLTGRKPFVASDSLAVMYKHINDSPPDPTQWLEPGTAGLASMLLKALRKEPAERFRSASELVLSLTHAPVHDSPIPLQQPEAKVSAPSFGTPVNVSGSASSEVIPTQGQGKAAKLSLTTMFYGVALLAVLIAGAAIFAEVSRGGSSMPGGKSSLATMPSSTQSQEVDSQLQSGSQRDPEVREARTLEWSELLVHASSIREKNPSKYGIELAFDGQLETAWNTASRDVGEWVHVTFKHGSFKLRSISIIPGYVKWQNDEYGDRWEINSKLKRAKFTFSDGSSLEHEFDVNLRTYQQVPNIQGIITSSIRIDVLAVEPGTKYRDLAISEIRIEVESDDQ